MATFTSAANTGTTEMDVISSIVQDELKRSAKLRPTVTDRSDMAMKGVKSIDLPRFDSSFAGPQPQNADGVTETAGQTLDFAVDTIDLNDWTSIVYKIPDRVSKQTMINLEGELAVSAGKDYGNYVDDQIIVQLRLATASQQIGIEDNDTSGLGASLVLEDISKARRLLNRANVPQDERFMLIPPEMEENIINLDNFRQADKYGSREALLQGEVGQIYGFRVIVHNGLAANEAVCYHRTAVAIAVQHDVTFETRRLPLGLQATEYSYAMGMGQTVLDEGKRQVYLLGA
jgi:N4-gp56 family major capsid protein